MVFMDCGILHTDISPRERATTNSSDALGELLVPSAFDGR